MTDDAVTSEGSRSKVTQAAAGVLSGRSLDAAIAEKVMGWTRTGQQITIRWGAATADEWLMPESSFGFGRAVVDPSQIPHYSTDLNTCFEAQAKRIEKVGMVTYLHALAALCGVVWGGNTCEDYEGFATADATTRCRAMLACSYNKGRA